VAVLVSAPKLLLVLVLASASLLAVPGADALARACGGVYRDGFSPTSITADGVSCPVARRVAADVSRGTSAGGCAFIARNRIMLTRPCRVRGYSCRIVRRLGERGFGIRVSCRNGARRVRFSVR